MDGVIYWMGFLLKVVLLFALLRYVNLAEWEEALCADISVHCVRRVIIWGLFWLVQRLYGVAVTISGWSLFLPGFKTLTLRTTNLELVSASAVIRSNLSDPTTSVISSSVPDLSDPTTSIILSSFPASPS